MGKIRYLALAMVVAMTACNRRADNAVLAETEAEQVRDAATAGRIFCALGGAQGFRLDCTMDRMVNSDGVVLVLGRADAGYRRFRVISDGRGVIAADGAEQAHVTVIDGGMIEVAVGSDRYRLPATIRGQD